MANRPFDANLHGVTRNPFHLKGKLVFALNFDDLSFTVNGQPQETADVVGAFPQRDVLIKLLRDSQGDVQVSPDDGMPAFEPVRGKVEVKGTPLTCGCSMGRFKVSRWWEVKLNARPTNLR